MARFLNQSFFAAITFSVLTIASSCAVDESGLGPATDARNDGPAATSSVCPESVIDKATWPAEATASQCTKRCGPDSIGITTCAQDDWATCQASGGCVCVKDAICAKCSDCMFFPALPDCYVPINSATPPTCASSVQMGGPCGPACGKTLCILRDGKMGCVCNENGVWACGHWTDSWK